MRSNVDHYVFFFFKQKTAYEMRISDWSSDVCSSDLMLGCAPSPPAWPPSISDWPPRLPMIVVARRDRVAHHDPGAPGRRDDLDQIGRASCRESVCQVV